MNWQPIETAPKDGTDIITWNGRWVDVSFWGRDGKCNRAAWHARFHGYSVDHIDQPTHWMSIPEPPK